LTTGEIITLNEYFNSGYDYISTIDNFIDDYFADNSDIVFAPFDGIDDESAYYLTETGFGFYFQAYVYTPGAYGVLDIPMNYSEFSTNLSMSL
jgi:hypothetical protein